MKNFISPGIWINTAYKCKYVAAYEKILIAFPVLYDIISFREKSGDINLREK